MLNILVSLDSKGKFSCGWSPGSDSPPRGQRGVEGVAHAIPQRRLPDVREVWIEATVPGALTVPRVPAAHRRRTALNGSVRKSNAEPVSRRSSRTRASLLTLTPAVLSEISHDRETERAYLTMEAR